MKNPWEEFEFISEYNPNGRYVLKSDEKEKEIENLEKRIEERCEKNKGLKGKHDEYRLRLNLLPEPFIGNKDAPIYLLSLNPGYTKENKDKNIECDEYYMPLLKDYIFKNYRHECPFFYYLEKDLKDTNGGKWWRKRLKELTDIFGPNGCDIVAKKIFCIEYFPYHSEKWIGGKTNIPSQDYSINLIRNAIKEDKIFIIMRHRADLFRLMRKGKSKPMREDDLDLDDAEKNGNVFFCANSDAPYIGKFHIAKKEGFDTIVDRIKKVI